MAEEEKMDAVWALKEGLVTGDSPIWTYGQPIDVDEREPAYACFVSKLKTTPEGEAACLERCMRAVEMLSHFALANTSGYHHVLVVTENGETVKVTAGHVMLARSALTRLQERWFNTTPPAPTKEPQE